MCTHEPPCPPADAPDREAARIISSHPEQGWSLLCNGIVYFDDAGELLPDGRAVAPRCSQRARRNRARITIVSPSEYEHVERADARAAVANPRSLMFRWTTRLKPAE